MKKSTKPKFRVGDLVRINSELPEYMFHFINYKYNYKYAIITNYSHNECQSGNSWEHDYSLYIKGHGEYSWYNESNLKIIRRNQEALLAKWKAEKEAKEKQRSNLNWIFQNGKKILKEGYGESILSLAKSLGYSDLWGSSGEGYDYCRKSIYILTLAMPFLESSDKSGWLTFARKVRKELKAIRDKEIL